jgi:hypothetical protein
MPSKDGGRNSVGTAPTAEEDPIVVILREHTQLQAVSERFRQIADALDRGEASARKDAAEGLDVHQRFLIGLHQRREALVAAEVRDSAEPAVRTALARCSVEHPIADRFQTEARACLGKTALSKSTAHRLAQLLRTEASRFVEHHRWEVESIYTPLRGKISKGSVERLTVAMRPLVGEAAASQSAMTSWTSHANPAAD